MGKEKQPSPPPLPRLYLATPAIKDASALAPVLSNLLPAADIAAVLVRLADADDRTAINRIRTVAAAIQPQGAALLIDGHRELVMRAGADGAHVSGIEALKEALEGLKPDRIVGVAGLHSRHDSMLAGEAGADYLLFGEPDDQRPSTEAIAERLEWWAELFEPPCVGWAQTQDEAELFAACGADFVMLGDLLWSDIRGPQAALADAVARIGVGHAARLKTMAAKHGTTHSG